MTPRGEGLLGGIVRLNLAVAQVLDRITGAHGITLADYLVLGVVRGSPGGRTAPTAIAEELGRTTGGMSLTLDRLVGAGWVERSRDPLDGRRVIVELTSTGTALATTVNRELHEWEASVAPATDPDEVLRIIDDLTEAVQQRAVLSPR